MDDERYGQAVRGVTQFWAWTVPALFLVLVLLGSMMRFNQAGIINAGADYFYAVMTLHGLGMVGTAFVAGFAGVTYLLARYVRVNIVIAWTVYVLTVVGVVGLVIACLIGRFGPGWYLLYPLPFFANGVWPDWASGLAVVSLIVLGVAWLLGQVDLFRALVARYGATNILAWQYLRKESAGKVEIPPIVLISAAGCLVPGILTTIDGAVLLMLYLFKWFSPALTLNPLLLKNMIFLWGHTLVNITMYLGLAIVYEQLPKYTGRPWKTNAVRAFAAVLFLVLLAFFHHLYMDFVQPVSLQYIGQVASYLSAVPATVVTVFGVIGQVYRSGMQWRFVPLCFCLGIIGWVIGGFAAVVDSTIAVNVIFHNTLWVPLTSTPTFAGYFLMLWGFLLRVLRLAREQLARWALLLCWRVRISVHVLFGRCARRAATICGVQQHSSRFIGDNQQRTAFIASTFVVLLIIGLLVLFGVIYGGLANRSLSTGPLLRAVNACKGLLHAVQSRNDRDAAEAPLWVVGRFADPGRGRRSGGRLDLGFLGIHLI
jgi:cytochrome c oxidase subunit 1